MARGNVILYGTAVRKSWYLWDDGSITNVVTQTQSYGKDHHYQGDLVKGDHITGTKYASGRYNAYPEQYHVMSDRKLGTHPVLKTQMFYVMHQEGQRGHDIPWSGEADAGSVPDWVVASARSQALAKLASSTVNVGQFLGEMPETLKMMAKTAITVCQAYHAVKRGDYRGVSRLLGVDKISRLPKSAADAWFAYKFGWLPLVTDVYNMQGAVSKQLNRPTTGKVTAVQVTDFCASKPYGWTMAPTNTQKGCQVGASYTVKSSTLAGLNSLGLINPASLAWELLPLSFVLDWFVPVGAFLSNLSAPLGLAFGGGYETRFARGRITWTSPPVANYPKGTPPKFSSDAFGMSRTPLTNWPKNELYIRTGLNPNQVATLLGLIAQRT